MYTYVTYVCVIYTISITLINYLRILLYDILIDSLRQRTFVLACGLVFKYMLLHFDWPPLSRIHPNKYYLMFIILFKFSKLINKSQRLCVYILISYTPVLY